MDHSGPLQVVLQEEFCGREMWRSHHLRSCNHNDVFTAWQRFLVKIVVLCVTSVLLSLLLQ